MDDSTKTDCNDQSSQQPLTVTSTAVDQTDGNVTSTNINTSLRNSESQPSTQLNNFERDSFLGDKKVFITAQYLSPTADAVSQSSPEANSKNNISKSSPTLNSIEKTVNGSSISPIKPAHLNKAVDPKADSADHQVREQQSNSYKQENDVDAEMEIHNQKCISDSSAIHKSLANRKNSSPSEFPSVVCSMRTSSPTTRNINTRADADPKIDRNLYETTTTHTTQQDRNQLSSASSDECRSGVVMVVDNTTPSDAPIAALKANVSTEPLKNAEDTSTVPKETSELARENLVGSSDQLESSMKLDSIVKRTENEISNELVLSSVHQAISSVQGSAASSSNLSESCDEVTLKKSSDNFESNKTSGLCNYPLKNVDALQDKKTLETVANNKSEMETKKLTDFTSRSSNISNGCDISSNSLSESESRTIEAVHDAVDIYNKTNHQQSNALRKNSSDIATSTSSASLSSQPGENLSNVSGARVSSSVRGTTVDVTTTNFTSSHLKSTIASSSSSDMTATSTNNYSNILLSTSAANMSTSSRVIIASENSTQVKDGNFEPLSSSTDVPNGRFKETSSAETDVSSSDHLHRMNTAHESHRMTNSEILGRNCSMKSNENAADKGGGIIQIVNPMEPPKCSTPSYQASNQGIIESTIRHLYRQSSIDSANRVPRIPPPCFISSSEKKSSLPIPIATASFMEDRSNYLNNAPNYRPQEISQQRPGLTGCKPHQAETDSKQRPLEPAHLRKASNFAHLKQPSNRSSSPQQVPTEHQPSLQHSAISSAANRFHNHREMPSVYYNQETYDEQSNKDAINCSQNTNNAKFKPTEYYRKAPESLNYSAPLDRRNHSSEHSSRQELFAREQEEKYDNMRAHRKALHIPDRKSPQSSYGKDSEASLSHPAHRSHSHENYTPSRSSALYMSTPDFSKQINKDQQMKYLSQKDLSQLHVKPPDFTKFKSDERREKQNKSKVALTSAVNSSPVSRSGSKYATSQLTPQNFEEFREGNNYVSDLQLKTPNHTASVARIEPHQKHDYNNLYIKAPDFSMKKFQQSPISDSEVAESVSNVIQHVNFSRNFYEHGKPVSEHIVRKYPQISDDVVMSVVATQPQQSLQEPKKPEQNMRDQSNQYYNYDKKSVVSTAKQNQTPPGHPHDPVYNNMKQSSNNSQSPQSLENLPVAGYQNMVHSNRKEFYSNERVESKTNVSKTLPNPSKHDLKYSDPMFQNPAQLSHPISPQSQRGVSNAYYPHPYQQIPNRESYVDANSFPPGSVNKPSTVIKSNARPKEAFTPPTAIQSQPTRHPLEMFVRSNTSPSYPQQQGVSPNYPNVQYKNSPSPTGQNRSYPIHSSIIHQAPSSSVSPACPPIILKKSSPSPAPMNPPYSFPSQYSSAKHSRSPAVSPHISSPYQISQSPHHTPPPHSPVFTHPSPKPSPSPTFLLRSLPQSPAAVNYKNPYITNTSNSLQQISYTEPDLKKSAMRTSESGYSPSPAMESKYEMKPIERRVHTHLSENPSSSQKMNHTSQQNPTSNYPKVPEKSARIRAEDSSCIKYPSEKILSKPTGSEKPNYRELINHAFAVRHATSEEDLNYQIIKRTLKKDISVRRSENDLSKNIFDVPVPTKSNSQYTRNSEVLQQNQGRQDPNIAGRSDSQRVPLIGEAMHAAQTFTYEPNHQKNIKQLPTESQIKHHSNAPMYYNELTRNDISVTVSKVIGQPTLETPRPRTHPADLSSVVISKVKTEYRAEDRGEHQVSVPSQASRMEKGATPSHFQNSLQNPSSSAAVESLKRESPLDLSVKTVKTKADSTGCDDHSGFNRAQHSANVLKVDFAPNFSKHAEIQDQPLPLVRHTYPNVSPNDRSAQSPTPFRYVPQQNPGSDHVAHQSLVGRPVSHSKYIESNAEATFPKNYTQQTEHGAYTTSKSQNHIVNPKYREPFPSDARYSSAAPQAHDLYRNELSQINATDQIRRENFGPKSVQLQNVQAMPQVQNPSTYPRPTEVSRREANIQNYNIDAAAPPNITYNKKSNEYFVNAPHKHYQKHEKPPKTSGHRIEPIEKLQRPPVVVAYSDRHQILPVSAPYITPRYTGRPHLAQQPEVTSALSKAINHPSHLEPTPPPDRTISQPKHPEAAAQLYEPSKHFKRPDGPGSQLYNNHHESISSRKRYLEHGLSSEPRLLPPLEKQARVDEIYKQHLAQSQYVQKPTNNVNIHELYGIAAQPGHHYEMRTHPNSIPENLNFSRKGNQVPQEEKRKIIRTPIHNARASLKQSSFVEHQTYNPYTRPQHDQQKHHQTWYPPSHPDEKHIPNNQTSSFQYGHSAQLCENVGPKPLPERNKTGDLKPLYSLASDSLSKPAMQITALMQAPPPTVLRGADQHTISKLRNSIEMREHEKQKLLVRKQININNELCEEETGKADIASLLAARIRTKGELKSMPLPLEKPAETTEQTPRKEHTTPPPPVYHIEQLSDTEAASSFDIMNWGTACNDFVEQLQTGGSKKRGKKLRGRKSLTDTSDTNNTELESAVDDLPGMEYKGDIDKMLTEQLKSDNHETEMKTASKNELKTPESDSSDEDKPLLLLRQQSHNDNARKFEGNKHENAGNPVPIESDASSVATSSRSGVVERLQDKLKQRIEQEKRLAARLSNTSSSDDDEKMLRNIQRSKKLLRKSITRRNNSAESESDIHSDSSLGKTKPSRNQKPTSSVLTQGKRKSNGKNSSDSDAVWQVKKSTRSISIIKSDEDKRTAGKGSTSQTKASDIFSKAYVGCMPSSMHNADEENSVNKDRKSINDQTKSMKGHESSDQHSESEVNKRKSSKTANRKGSKKAKIDQKPDETMTRSKRKRELEQQIADSKVLRNEKVIRNTFVDRKNKGAEKTPKRTKSNEDKTAESINKSSAKKSLGPAKRKTGGNDESHGKIERKFLRSSKQQSTSSSSELSDGSDTETVSDRLRSRRSRTSLDHPEPKSKSRETSHSTLTNKSRPKISKEDPEKKKIAKTPASKKTVLLKQPTCTQEETSLKTTKFPPGWEREVYHFKRSLKIPPRLINITGPAHQRVSTSLPDLDAPSSDASESFQAFADIKLVTEKGNMALNLPKKRGRKPAIKIEMETATKHEETLKPTSIIDVLHQRVFKTNKANKKKSCANDLPKILPRASSNEAELLPTPGVKNKDVFGIEYRGPNEEHTVFATEILKSRTRTENRILKTKELMREVFGVEDRPASAPPEIHENDPPIKQEVMTFEQTYEQYLEKMNIDFGEKIRKIRIKPRSELDDGRPSIPEYSGVRIKVEKPDEEPPSMVITPDDDETQDTEINACMHKPVVVKHEGNEGQNERGSPCLTSEREGVVTPLLFKRKKGSKTRNSRRKGSSGFDYIRKKKKPTPPNLNGQELPKRKKITPLEFLQARNENDVSKEIQRWVLNKSVGQSALHKAARLGYIDVIAYCLERIRLDPDVKDNAGYTPLHEACGKGRLDIARLLLQYGANHSETALSGIRPLHEASENGYIEIVRLLLAYGADPLLTTYSGQTPLMLAESDEMKQLIRNHLQDVQDTGPHKKPWKFEGQWKRFDDDESGFDILAGAPEFSEKEDDDEEDSVNSLKEQQFSYHSLLRRDLQSKISDSREKCDSNSNIMTFEEQMRNASLREKSSFREKLNSKCTVVLKNINTSAKQFQNLNKKNVSEEHHHRKFVQRDSQSASTDEESDLNAEVFEFEETELPLPPLYLLRDEGADKWVLFSDLCNLLKVKSKDTLLKQLCPALPLTTVNKEMLRELKMSEFLERATCLQLLCAGEKLNIRASKVVLVKYNESVRNLLGVRSVVMKF